VCATQDDDKGGRNSGFMMMKATPWALGFLARSLRIAEQAKNMRQQKAVNKALAEMQSKPFTMKVLPVDEFPCGMMYFEKPQRRMFFDEKPCDKCVIMHNNWIVGTGAKVYRFKEHLKWFVDDDQYYTSPTGAGAAFALCCCLVCPPSCAVDRPKMLRVWFLWSTASPLPPGRSPQPPCLVEARNTGPQERVLTREGDAWSIASCRRQRQVPPLTHCLLRCVLALLRCFVVFPQHQASGRILILPVFHCHKCRMTGLGAVDSGCRGKPGDRDACNFLAHFKVGALDKSGLLYREAMFRRHPWVPDGVSHRDDEELFFIESAAEPLPASNRQAQVTNLTPQDPTLGACVVVVCTTQTACWVHAQCACVCVCGCVLACGHRGSLSRSVCPRPHLR